MLTTLSYHVFYSFFLINDLYILITAVIAQIFIPFAELTIPLKTPTNEGNAEIKTQPIIAETKVFKVFKLIQRPTHFLCF